jgi:8-oxo-dGTP pyrophosphatase MutT (NUDIX family)
MARNYSIFVNNSVLHIVAAEANHSSITPDSVAAANHLYAMYLDYFATPETAQSATVFVLDVVATFKAFEEKFTPIAAAGGLVWNPQGAMLWIFRLGKWDLPKGKLEATESPESCAVREVSEECGLPEADLHIAQPLPATYHTYYFKNQHVLKTTYWYEMLYVGKATLKPQIEEDIQDVRWLSKAEILELAVPNTYHNILNLLKNVAFL